MEKTGNLQQVLQQIEHSTLQYKRYYEAEMARMQQEAKTKGVELNLTPGPAVSAGAMQPSQAAMQSLAKRPHEGEVAGGAEKMQKTVRVFY
eukprot:SAG31_NODE_54_length_29987_cov_4.570664_10_plen_91_part_00